MALPHAQLLDVIDVRPLGDALADAVSTSLIKTEHVQLLHLVLPIVGMVLFFFPLYYQFYEAPPTYPIKGANWVALAWAVIGVVLTVWLARRRPDKLRDMERVYVED